MSNCSCDSIAIENITTLIRSFYPNGKRAVDTVILISSNCEIGDPAISTYDTLGQITQFQQGNYSWSRFYDSTGALVNETTFLPTETIYRKFEHLKKGDELHSTTVYQNDVKQSITRYNGRKAKTTYLNKNRVEILKYNNEKKVIRHISKAKEFEGKRYFVKIKNTFNAHGELVKSIRTENGKQTEIVETYYENGRDIKEVRHKLARNTIITTYYRYD